jgi:ArsR family transcriptional regulator
MKPKCCKNKKSIANLSQTAEFLKIISEENRLKILCLLREGEKCVCEIWQHLNLPQNLVSHHLKVLKDFKLISSKKVGCKVFYQLNQKAVKKYLKLLNNFLNSYEKQKYNH